ncbi:ABC transporter permease [Microvirga makkahensis]|uniref:ABC transporter permease n=1 Tax=Microvirga makkahensis TaxID=1128670 RepID=A0A7X3MWL4_9HYPH|nr:ABC transporter permease [Microvirga makkahensis]MXQ14618.1 ABC transporter permease [Microvirga makkahensis]
MQNLSPWMARNRWIWSLIGILIIWGVLSLITERLSLHSLSGVVASASFLVLAALGQMFVVTTGRGNIDLSIASVIALSAFVSLIVIDGSDERIVLGLLAVLGIGLAVGAMNAVLVLLFRIPAMIATLATGYVLATTTLIANRSIAGAVASPTLAYLAGGRVWGIPVIFLIALVAVTLSSLVLGKLAYGRMLSATGQNARAARLSGIKTGRVTATAFLISSVLAALDGALLSAYVGGAFLEMGAPYLLQSVGAVVLGGSLIFGGSSTALGTLFGCILLVLIVTTMQIAGLPPGTQDIVQGVAIIGVLALAGRPVLKRAARLKPMSEQTAGAQ